MTKMVKNFGAVGMQQSISWCKAKDLSRCQSAPEAIWRQADGKYCRAWRTSNDVTWHEIDGNIWATKTLTIAEWFKRYA